MRSSSSRVLFVLVAIAVFAVGATASPATGKKTKRVHLNLEGPISKPKDPGYAPFSHLCCFPSYVPTIQIKAKFGGSKKSSVKVTAYGLWGPCSGAEYSDGLSKEEITLKPKKNRSFAGTHTKFDNTLTVSGQILRNGTASGVVRVVEDRGPPTNSHSYGICDSGTVPWTASKVPVLSEVKGSYNPNLVYPEGL